MKWMHDEGTRNLLADIEKADPFEGGCAADVTADPAHGGPGGTMGDAAAAKRVTCGDTVQSLCKQIGLREAICWLLENGWENAGQALANAAPEIKAKMCGPN